MPPTGRSSSGSGRSPLDPAQRAIRTLARRIARAPLVEVEGTLCRAVRAKHLRRIPPEPLYCGGSQHGARYTPRDGPAGLYLAMDTQTALAELKLLVHQAQSHPLMPMPHDPVTLVAVGAKVGRVLDLTDSGVRRVLRVSRKSILADWQAPMLEYLKERGAMPVTQQIGLATHITGAIAGILYPSARLKGGKCLVVFPDRLEGRDRIASFDSTGALAQLLTPTIP